MIKLIAVAVLAVYAVSGAVAKKECKAKPVASSEPAASDEPIASGQPLLPSQPISSIHHTVISKPNAVFVIQTDYTTIAPSPTTLCSHSQSIPKRYGNQINETAIASVRPVPSSQTTVPAMRSMIFITETDYTTVTPTLLHTPGKKNNTVYTTVTSAVTIHVSSSAALSAVSGTLSPIYSGSDIPLPTYSSSSRQVAVSPAPDSFPRTSSVSGGDNNHHIGVSSSTSATSGGFVYPTAKSSATVSTPAASKPAPTASKPATSSPAASSKPGVATPISNNSTSIVPSHPPGTTSSAKTSSTARMCTKKLLSSIAQPTQSTATSNQPHSKLTSMPLKQSSTAVAVPPIQQSSTAVVVIPIETKPTITAKLGKLEADSDAPIIHFWEHFDHDAIEKRKITLLEPREAHGEAAAYYRHGINPVLYDVKYASPIEYRAAVPEPATITLPIELVEEKASATSSAAKPTSVTPIMMPKPSTTPKPKGSASSSKKGSNVKTTVISQDSRCPYPYPGIHCGSPLTTLTTETKKPIETKTSEPEKTGWCPYPYPGSHGEAC